MDIAIAIITSAVLGCVIGFTGAALMASRKYQRLERDTWSAANRYYSRRYDPTPKI